MSRLYITNRELNLMSDITKEFIRDVVGQKIYYFAINENKTRNSELYNESSQKIYDAPIELPALVNSPERKTDTNIFGPDALATLELFLHYQDIIDVGINVSIGDFIRYGDIAYEITNLTRLRNIYGHTEQLDGIKLNCSQARKGQLDPPQLGPSSIEYSDSDAVQKDFNQTRGTKIVKGEQTGDQRALQENGVLEPPITGAEKVVREDERTGSDFYGEKS